MRILPYLLLGALALGAQTPDLTEKLQQAALSYAEAQAAGLSGTTSIRVLRPPTLPRLPEGEVRFEPLHASKPEFAGPFFVAFKIYVNERPAGSARVDLEGRWVGKLLRTRAALARKAIPEETQLEEVPFEGVPPPGAIAEFPSGFQLKVPVGPGHILSRADLEAIPIINAGDPVRLELVYGPAVVTSECVARTSGGLGEKIRLELPNSRRNIQALITGPGTARIEWVKTGS